MWRLSRWSSISTAVGSRRRGSPSRRSTRASRSSASAGELDEIGRRRLPARVAEEHRPGADRAAARIALDEPLALECRRRGARSCSSGGPRAARARRPSAPRPPRPRARAAAAARSIDWVPVRVSGIRRLVVSIPHCGTAVPRTLPAVLAPVNPGACETCGSTDDERRGGPVRPTINVLDDDLLGADRQRGKARPRRGRPRDPRAGAARAAARARDCRSMRRGERILFPPEVVERGAGTGTLVVHALRPRRAPPRRHRRRPGALRPGLERAQGPRPSHRRDAAVDLPRLRRVRQAHGRAGPHPVSRDRLLDRRRARRTSPTHGGSTCASSTPRSRSSRARSPSTACRGWSS